LLYKPYFNQQIRDFHNFMTWLTLKVRWETCGGVKSASFGCALGRLDETPYQHAGRQSAAACAERENMFDIAGRSC
jgi:hypothetical protein